MSVDEDGRAPRDVSPFSWMHYIVLSRSDYEAVVGNASERCVHTGLQRSEALPTTAIIAHERGHIRLRHSLDLLLVDTLTALQWFNPAMWMLRQDLRAIHEYEADAAVLSQGINMRQYQYLLIQKAVAACGYSVANGITHSTLKNRITMMLKNKKSNRKSMFKLLALLPIVGITLALNAETVTDYVYDNTLSQPDKKIVKKGRKDAQNIIADTVYAIDTSDGEPLANPLIIIDGKRATTAQFRSLDSKTVDHIDVLKEKTGVELYGEEGKHGVIIVTTKGEKVLFLGKANVDSTGTKFKEAKMETVSEHEDVFDVVEQMPEFPGGMEAMMKFLMENVHYPEAALKTGAQGRVIVTFIVESDGCISNAKVVRKVNDDLDAEAIRVIGSMPKWKPGMQNGKVVRVRYTLPISFQLN
jgi:TonB family protein